MSSTKASQSAENCSRCSMACSMGRFPEKNSFIRRELLKSISPEPSESQARKAVRPSSVIV